MDIGSGVSIHPQAAPLVSRHVLDALISLAKAFPHQFLTSGDKSEDKSGASSQGSQKDVSVDASASPGTAKINKDADFWDVLVKLDSLSTSRKGKNVLKTHTASNTSLSTSGVSTESDSADEGAPLRSVLQLLSHPVIRRSAALTDRLLRLLSLISLALPSHEHHNAVSSDQTRGSIAAGRFVSAADLASSGLMDSTEAEKKEDKEKDKKEESEPNDNKPPLVGEEQLKLAVEVLISKSCSEEGLEDVNSLLLRLSRSCPKTRDIVLKLLLSGAQTVGKTVKDNIDCLYEELKSLSQSAAVPSTSASTDDDSSSHMKGVLQDRFTKEKVVITAPNFKPSMVSKEVQLPSMATLTSKTSSQSFFLRILKVIIQLRDSIRSQKKKNSTSRSRESQRSDVNRLRMEVASVQAALHELENEVDGINEDAAHDVDPLHRERRRLAEAMVDVNQAAQELDAAVQEVADLRGEFRAEMQAQLQAMDVDATQSTSAVVVEEEPPSSTSTTTPVATNSVVEPVAGPSKEKESEIAVEEPSLSSQLSLEDLWNSLTRCLLELADAPDHHAVLVLQPAVEAFFLVHASEREKKKTTGNESRETQLAHINLDLPPASPQAVTDGSDVGASSQTPAQPALPPDTQKFLEFAETHKLVLNQILRQSTTPLVDGPFAVLVDHTRVLDFDVKRRYFRQELERLDDGLRREDLAVHVRREHVFEDSYRELYRRSPEDWKNRFYIVFEGEEGQDAGGLLREWYTIISREIFNPMYALFTTSPGDRVTYMINSSSHCNSNHLSYFKFVGRVIAKAIYDNKLLECYFTRSFYKHILGKPVK
jgi:E3 ubiquitin-protein ligase HUWE1